MKLQKGLTRRERRKERQAMEGMSTKGNKRKREL